MSPLVALCTLRFEAGTSSPLLVGVHLDESWKRRWYNFIREARPAVGDPTVTLVDEHEPLFE